MNTETAELVSEIKTLVEVLQRPAVPIDKQWWDMKTTADYLGVSISTLEKYRGKAGFPVPKRLPSDRGLGSLRFSAREVMQWMERR